VVREFTLAGLYDAVAADPARLDDGYRVLATLTTIANGRSTHGLNLPWPSASAGSMAGYVRDAGPALAFEANARSVVVVDGVEIDLGTYDELVGLLRRRPAKPLCSSGDRPRRERVRQADRHRPGWPVWARYGGRARGRLR